jgi:signal transduction histidine kinase
LLSIESITVDGHKLDAAPSLTLAIRPHKVQIAFVGISLSSPDRVRYRYLLEHEDGVWQEGNTDHLVSYTNLAPGTYRFLVSARNSDGVWSKTSAVSTFSIPPAFTQTRLFAVAVILVSIAFLWSLYFLRIGYLTARMQERMRDRVSERLRIARDLHDTLLQGVQGLVMRLHFTAAQMPPADATRQTLMSALDHADEVLEESRNSLLRLRSEEGADPDIAEALRKLAAQLGRDSHVSFTLAVDGEQRPLQPLIQEELSFIFREALTNALQHALATSICARLSYMPNELRLLLRDDGIGLREIAINTRRRQGHWGIQGMRERAARIGANIHLSSPPGDGTTVKVHVPARSAYASDSSLAWGKRFLQALTAWREFTLPAKSRR